MIRKILCMLIASFVIGCLITQLTTFFFVHEMKGVERQGFYDGRYYVSVTLILNSVMKGFPLPFHIQTTILDVSLNIDVEKLGRLQLGLIWGGPADEIVMTNLLWNIAFHTFATLGIMGILIIGSKKSKLRIHDLVTP